MAVLAVLYIPKSPKDSTENKPQTDSTVNDNEKQSQDPNATEVNECTSDDNIETVCEKEPLLPNDTTPDKNDADSEHHEQDEDVGGICIQIDPVEEEVDVLLKIENYEGNDPLFEKETNECPSESENNLTVKEKEKDDDAGTNVGTPQDDLKTPDTQEDEAKSIMEIEEFTLVEAVQVVLEELGIIQDVWEKAAEENFWQVSFVMEVSQSDVVLRKLTDLGIGKIENTSISLFPSNYHVGRISGQPGAPSDCTVEKKSKFMKSVNSRLIVAQVVDNVKANASLTFDFVMLVVLASLIAAVGLAENSSVVLVASMLVSPIMGPILGGTFGFVVKHGSLQRLGIKNELISLAICIICGFAMGLLTGGVCSQGAVWGSTSDWPTMEMKSRGLARGLWVGILIALPSGAGVALSILGGNSGSLVGVAISASLLPPAVNAGMLWAYAMISAISPPELISKPVNNTAEYLPPPSGVNLTENNIPVTELLVHPEYYTPPACLHLRDNEYQFVYSCYMPYEAAIMGVISLVLTVVNIICIFIMGIIFLKIKEVAPEYAVSEHTRSFWKEDIQVAREAYKTYKPTDNNLSTREFAKKIAADARETIFPNRSFTGLKEGITGLVKNMKEDDSFGHSDALQGLSLKTRPLLIKQLSQVADSFDDTEPYVEQVKYHTVTNSSSIKLDPVTPSAAPFDLSSPFTAPSVVRRKRGRLMSPGGPEFEFDPSSRKKRHERTSMNEEFHKRHTSVPDNLKFPALKDPGIPRSASGRFVISPVPEENTTE